MSLNNKFDAGKFSNGFLPSEHYTAGRAIPGIDTQAGLARVGGRVALYRKMLEQFRHNEADTPQRIPATLTVGDPATVKREA